ncbi:MAG: pilus assembly protein PilQ [Gammaproteobacteria bacterium]|nr:MAG: pilus assembly protein PilQ [Gammaproteobacteria bacterium]
MIRNNRNMMKQMVENTMLITTRIKMFMKYLLLGMVLFISNSSMAAELKSLDYSTLPGDKVQIALTFSESVEQPNTFSIDDPARIVLDFANVSNKSDKKRETVNIGATDSISIIEAGSRTRVVVNLDQKVPYSIEQKGAVTLITIEGGIQKEVVTSKGDFAVEDIQFRRGEDGQARLMISLNNDNVPVDVHQQRDTVVVDLVGVSLPDNLRRRLDVIDFATPVNMIDAVQKGNTTSLTLTTKGKFEHLSYQSGNMLVIEIKPITEALKEAQKDEFGYQGEQLSLNFQNIEVRAVLQLLADFTGMNLVTSDTVQGNLTLRLKNVPWDQALDIILKTKGLAMRQNGNVMLIAPASEIAAREKQELAAQKQLVELEPLYSEIIEINFAKATDLVSLLSSGSGDESGAGVAGFLSSRGSATVDERTNSLLLRDTANQLVQIRKLIEKLDIPIRQVLIESRIVIANNDFAKNLGVRFGATAESNTLGAATSSSLSDLTLDSTGDGVSPGTILGDSLNVNLPAAGAAGTFALALAKLPLGAILELELSAMQTEGQGEIISSPRVITSNQKTALIEQGTEIPYQEASSSGSTSVSFKKAVLKLEVTPQITPDDRIVMDLEINKDAVGQEFQGIPSIDTRKIKTQVLVDNGETVVLGGIYEQTKTTSSTRVPFFGDLPYVGFLFKTNSKKDDKKELLIFVTPKIIKDSLNF